MSHLVTRCFRTSGGRRGRQAGQTLISTLAITSIVGMLVVASLVWAKSSTGQSARTARADIALQAAEAGLQQYVSRIVESRRFWNVYVDSAEDPRISTTTGVQVNPGTAWTGGEWTYSGPSVTWRPLTTARFGDASYSLRIYPLKGSSSGLRVQSTARVQAASGRNPVYASVVAAVSPLNLADFQMVSDSAISYGATATTTGQIYSNQSISHMGLAREKLYARNFVCRSGSGTCSSSNASYFGALAFDRTTTPSFASRIKVPIDFSQFAYDRALFKQSAQTPGLGHYFNDSTARGWMLQFPGNGTLLVWKLTSSSAPDLESAVPTMECPVQLVLRGGSLENHFYFEQPVVMGTGVAQTTKCDTVARTRDSVVDGRVTIATSSSIYIGGNIRYQDPASHVLGLIAANNIVMPRYVPYNLTWTGATLAESGQWRTAAGATNDSKGTLRFVGSTATKGGGYASMFRTRDYQWDANLAVTGAPPQFPEIDGTWDVQDWRAATPPG